MRASAREQRLVPPPGASDPTALGWGLEVGGGRGLGEQLWDWVLPISQLLPSGKLAFQPFLRLGLA